MKSENVKIASLLLNLSKKIVGVKFLDFEETFEAFDVPVTKHKGSICFHARKAMDGEIFKARAENVICDYGRYAVGLSIPDSTIVQGRSFEYCGLAETKAVGKSIVSSMKYIDHLSYGIAMGPLDQMEDADMVMLADYAEVIMRVMQGYAYKYGNPENLSFFGNQAACADLISKPYSNNDLNISLMCRGARTYGRFDKGEVGVSMPIGMFDAVVNGIVKTFTPVAHTAEKKRVLAEIDDDHVLNKEIDVSYNYGIGLKKYDNWVLNKRQNDIS